MAQQSTYTENLRYRRLGDDDDYVMGVQDAIIDGLPAMAQAIKTRLRVVKDEWWEGDDTALPYFYDILGHKHLSRETLDLRVIARIIDTIGVLSVRDVQSTLSGRSYSFSAIVNTVYGETTAEVTV